MLRHKAAKHGGGEGEAKNFVCEDCGQTFFNVRSLGGHRRKHARVKEGVLSSMIIPTKVNVGVRRPQKLEPKTVISPSISEFEDMPDSL